MHRIVHAKWTGQQNNIWINNVACLLTLGLRMSVLRLSAFAGCLLTYHSASAYAWILNSVIHTPGQKRIGQAQNCNCKRKLASINQIDVTVCYNIVTSLWLLHELVVISNAFQGSVINEIFGFTCWMTSSHTLSLCICLKGSWLTGRLEGAGLRWRPRYANNWDRWFHWDPVSESTGASKLISATWALRHHSH